MNYTCAIIEKEPLAEATLKRYISRIGFLDLVWTASSAEEAKQEVVDLLLVGMTTTSLKQDDALRDLITAHEHVIITSIYPQEAESILPNLVAFLTKPISFNAFIKALEIFLERKA